jgi:uncharacterized protein YkwD
VYLLLQTPQTENSSQAAGVQDTQFYSPEQVITAVNNVRENQGLEPLTPNDKLMQAAQNKAEDMKKNQYFSHVSPTDGKKWSTFIKQADYEYSIAGENLAKGYYEVDLMVQAWMDSPTHRANILNKKVSETGVGLVYGTFENQPTIFVAQTFGEPQKSNSAEVKSS